MKLIIKYLIYSIFCLNIIFIYTSILKSEELNNKDISVVDGVAYNSDGFQIAIGYGRSYSFTGIRINYSFFNNYNHHFSAGAGFGIFTLIMDTKLYEIIVGELTNHWGDNPYLFTFSFRHGYGTKIHFFQEIAFGPVFKQYLYKYNAKYNDAVQDYEMLKSEEGNYKLNYGPSLTIGIQYFDPVYTSTFYEIGICVYYVDNDSIPVTYGKYLSIHFGVGWKI